ncbi:MAG: DUF2281 domain-containing protein [Halothece sp. Uz-M2-17]|nr:DUF2281 domain-containing protein [Halothece sp. Uz-M2-17]
MTKLEQLNQEIQELPEEAQDLLIDFIQILKKRYREGLVEQEKRTSFLEDAAEFAGCVEGGPSDLATNKEYLEGLGEK